MVFRSLGIFLSFLLSLMLSSGSYGFTIRSAKISIPEFCELIPPKGVKAKRTSTGGYHLYFSNSTVFPLEIIVRDPFGTHVSHVINDPSQIGNLSIKQGYVKMPNANPVYIEKLPKFCGRGKFEKNDLGTAFIYEGRKDILNHKPRIQLFDDDARYIPAQQIVHNHINSKNGLRVAKVRLTYDYEDSTILDYQGPHPESGEPHMVYEGEGGFYANLHYSVFPFNPKVEEYSRQEILSLVQGRLKDIDKVDLAPAIRTHGFLPGPYETPGDIYPMCEWGDTAFHAKEQTVYYNDLYIWDWDLVRDLDQITVVVWEGDEEYWMVADKILDPFYLTDDIVGIFHVNRFQTENGFEFENETGDFQITFVTD